tara:strand:+ start:340 stop:603 length:264 start_codon:yes stop_codon:yes gene_type:complete
VFFLKSTNKLVEILFSILNDKWWATAAPQFKLGNHQARVEQFDLLHLVLFKTSQPTHAKNAEQTVTQSVGILIKLTLVSHDADFRAP